MLTRDFCLEAQIFRQTNLSFIINGSQPDVPTSSYDQTLYKTCKILLTFLPDISNLFFARNNQGSGILVSGLKNSLTHILRLTTRVQQLFLPLKRLFASQPPCKGVQQSYQRYKTAETLILFPLKSAPDNSKVRKILPTFYDK